MKNKYIYYLRMACICDDVNYHKINKYAHKIFSAYAHACRTVDHMLATQPAAVLARRGAATSAPMRIWRRRFPLRAQQTSAHVVPTLRMRRPPAGQS